MILSFFVGGVVFHSKEFADPKMTRLGKCFFYILNSIIIFAMATGTHAVLDKGKNQPRTTISSWLPRNAYAQETKTGLKPMTQKRPFFHDWTTAWMSYTQGGTGQESGLIKFNVKKDYGAIKGFFVDVGLAVPEYKVRVMVDESKLDSPVKSVNWSFPEHYFSEKMVTVTDKDTDYAVAIQAWKPFQIGAEIELESGKKLRVNKHIFFEKVKQ